MTDYNIVLTCPSCGADVNHLTEGRALISSIRAVCQCTECEASWLLTVTLSVVTPPRNLPPGGGRPAAKCGTDAGHSRHVRRHEPPCDACRQAHRAVKANLKQRARELEKVGA